ncbi:hypothetical protein V1512DRAFT_259710 [Lipomyces arxii]|uniref:uncharacterized protein n=1 Tax=Lipomyces arxii TaxID=56418 RepID=UPI0034CD9B59
MEFPAAQPVRASSRFYVNTTVYQKPSGEIVIKRWQPETAWSTRVFKNLQHVAAWLGLSKYALPTHVASQSEQRGLGMLLVRFYAVFFALINSPSKIICGALCNLSTAWFVRLVHDAIGSNQLLVAVIFIVVVLPWRIVLVGLEKAAKQFCDMMTFLDSEYPDIPTHHSHNLGRSSMMHNKVPAKYSRPQKSYTPFPGAEKYVPDAATFTTLKQDLNTFAASSSSSSSTRYKLFDPHAAPSITQVEKDQ